jgi:cation:H+ antiporter
VYGAEWLVKGSASLARNVGVSQMVIGLTVVAIGTSTPELAVSVLAALQGKTDVAIGNVIGSNIANLGLILGITAIVRAVPVAKTTIVKDIPVMIGAAVAIMVFTRDAAIGRWDGVVLIMCCAAYLGSMLGARLKDPPTAREEIEVFDPSEERPAPSRAGNVVRIVAGIVALVIGGRLLVDSATFYARLMGVSDMVIGLTVVAVGTSLPELATSVMAAVRGHSDLALGNVIGSNILNILLVLGATSLIRPLPVHTAMFSLEIPMMVGISLALLPIALRKSRITRGEGVLLVLAYLAFLIVLLHGNWGT